jgi:hypothetical protein
MSWAETCSRCQGTRFWPSRSGYLVCWWCAEGDPLTALLVLARRQPGCVAQVESWLAGLAQARLAAAGQAFNAANEADKSCGST